MYISRGHGRSFRKRESDAGHAWAPDPPSVLFVPCGGGSAMAAMGILDRVARIGGVVLVEGASDQVALEALAMRLDRNLAAEGVSIVAMGGASAIGEFLEDLVGPGGPSVRLAGLYDEAEIGDFRRGLERAGFGSDLSRSSMEALGFYACVVDLEDELIRALGVDSVEEVIDEQGELRSFRTLQNQPAWRGKPIANQLRRFISAKSGRKLRYGRLLVDALDLTRVPRPLARVLRQI